LEEAEGPYHMMMVVMLAMTVMTMTMMMTKM
jgi:hypothetical protein